MPPRKPADDSAGIESVEYTADELAAVDADADAEFAAAEVVPVPDKVKARYVGIEPVMAHFNGEAVLVAPGDLIMVSVEQLEQNPVFIPWED